MSGRETSRMRSRRRKKQLRTAQDRPPRPRAPLRRAGKTPPSRLCLGRRRCRGRGKDIAAEQAARSAAGLEVEARRGGGQGQGVRAGKVLQFQGRTRAAGLEHDPGRGPDLGIAGGEGGTIQRGAEEEGGICPQLAQEVLKVELFPLSSPEDLQHRLAGSWGGVTKGTR